MKHQRTPDRHTDTHTIGCIFQSFRLSLLGANRVNDRQTGRLHLNRSPPTVSECTVCRAVIVGQYSYRFITVQYRDDRLVVQLRSCSIHISYFHPNDIVMQEDEVEEELEPSTSTSFLVGQPPIRIWELNETTSTRWDYLVAAPSDDQLTVMWSIWAVVFGTIALFTSMIVSVICLSKRVRQSSFNCYLVFLFLPDILLIVSCTFTCAQNAIAGHYRNARTGCYWQSWYIIFGMATNTWLNAVIARELHKMLRSSQLRQHYYPPTRRRVCLESIAVYLSSTFIAALPLMSIPYLKVRAQAGLLCIPLEFDLPSALFFWLFFTQLLVLLPMTYVFYVIYDVWKRSLLPPRGLRRTLGIYFLRICVIFVVMWPPTIICLYVLHGISPWAIWTAGMWAHFQTLFSALASLMKPDIFQAVKEFVTCKCHELGKVGRPSLPFRASSLQSSSRVTIQAAARDSSVTVTSGEPVSRSESSTNIDYVEAFPKQDPETFVFDDEADPIGTNSRVSDEIESGDNEEEMRTG